MSKKKVKQSYLTQSDCLKIIEYQNDLLDVLSKCIIYKDTEEFITYQRKYYNFKYLFQHYIMSFNNFTDFENICNDDDFGNPEV